MTGKRTVKVHGEKIAKARAEKKLDQESFARSAGVSVRTVQRAENSEGISPSKVGQIADALRISPEELTRDEFSAASTNLLNDGYGTLILRPMRSYKDLQKLILSHGPEKFDLDYQINPQPEYVEKVAAVIKEIQGWLDASNADLAEGPDLAERFRKDMAFTQNLIDVWAGGISVFAGHYTFRQLRREDSFSEAKWWVPYSQNFAALRFFDDENIIQKDEISERVHYGLSKSTSDRWQYSDVEDLTDYERTLFKDFFSADNQINPKIELDEEIPF